MPDMDGFEVVEHIHKDRDLAGATIMMLTSAGQRGDAALCRKLGIAAYMIKPIRQSELLEAILMALGGIPQERKPPPLITQHTLREARRKLRVLLAEDNTVNQTLAVRLLGKRGHSVVVAANGRKALEALHQQEFDVVLMDIQMPEMDGFEATATLREEEKRTGRHMPIIAMTAHAMKGDREQCLARGMDGYVSKPIQGEDLFAAIETAVPVQAGGPSPESPQEVLDKATIEAAVPVQPGGPPPELPPEVLDKATLLDRVEGDMELLGDMASMFLQECPRYLLEVRQAVARRDAAALQSSAHTLKGSVGNFAALKAAQAALQLEMMGREGDLAKSEPALRELEVEIERLKPVLEEFAKGGSQ
jgi:CheY-like chemotaxis protein